MVNVKKADGSLQIFKRGKVLRTCRRMGLSGKEAEEVVSEIERKIYDGIPTKKIINMILQHGKRHKPHFGHMRDLREALGGMRSKPDFEQFVAMLLENRGYKTETNKIVRGKCVEHEVDVIATKGGEVIYVEVKHHDQFHTFTGLDTLLEINSTFQDLADGYSAGKNKHNFTNAMLVTNTKVSNHARSYASCRGIDAIAWQVPPHRGIESYIHDKSFYPITILKDIDKNIQGKLGDSGVYTIEQLVKSDRTELSKSTGLAEKYLAEIVQKAEQILRR